ncbi:uncharacterized protein LOC110722527 [Chenopodium quinoa]|uniref:uncharacterized protein LOC110722527 n=1 Tax=Chenopodium quinoa TaxID=63459 RepID=UPI000B78AB01|nr:uncharacterized protein LOC110722527 [Chenopodium quinoa]
MYIVGPNVMHGHITDAFKDGRNSMRQRSSKRSRAISALLEPDKNRLGLVISNVPIAVIWLLTESFGTSGDYVRQRSTKRSRAFGPLQAADKISHAKQSQVLSKQNKREPSKAHKPKHPQKDMKLAKVVHKVHEGIAKKKTQPKPKVPTAPVQKKKKEPAAVIGQPLPLAPLQLENAHYCIKCRAKNIQIAVNALPIELYRLFTSQDEDAIHFRKYSRMYNNLFAFCSLGGKYNAKIEKGIYVFLLHGQIYHNLPDLLPEDEKPKYLQLYFYDAQFEAKHRTKTFPEVRRDIVEILMRVTNANPYARFFRSLRELTITHSTQIAINQSTVLDQRVYNAPSTDEVAAIWPDSTSSSDYNSPYIVVTGRSNDPHRIYHYYGCYDPLQYPLLFPYGECGWTQGMRKIYKNSQQEALMDIDPIDSCAVHSAESFIEEEAKRATNSSGTSKRHISPREYYAYKLQIRPGNMLLRGGRCFQQYIVDMYVKIENTRLDFFRRNQQAIRADLYQGILDTVEDGEKNASNVGRRVILPPTFIGGPRDLKKRYLNAMALVQRFGKPDLFVTMTCNAKWPEITAELSEGEVAADRPDVIARVFRSKLIALKKQITEERVFGKVAAMVYVVEFQKRGLPHAHFLIILDHGYKLTGPSDYDRFVSAEIPATDSPELRKIVLKHMMHGPCGNLHPNCGCMKKQVGDDVVCKYNYPRSYIKETTTNEYGFPLYKRRNTGEHVRIRGATLDNRWVIPYNPYLSMLFYCHLNVEVCSTIQAVKYLYKYVYKGHDRVSFNIGEGNNQGIDEIDNFQAGRWVSPCEAAWRIFGFDLFEMTPSVMVLPVHLPNMQTIYLRSNEDLESVVQNEKRSQTALTEFFRLNAHINGGTGERFFLRLLLSKIISPTSFEHLRTISGVLYPTFQDAAIRHGLFQEDNATTACLEEAAEAQMPSAMRQLFATLLIFCQPSNPVALWDRFYSSLSEGFNYKYPNCQSKVKNLTVREVESGLVAMGKSLENFGLGHLIEETDDRIRVTKDIEDALDAPIPPECLDCRSKLNEAQASAFNSILSHIEDGKPGCFFVDGPGGTGKTFLYNSMYAEVRLSGKIVLPTETSGIAASNIPSGRTAHSRFKIPLDSDLSIACDVPNKGA